MPAPGSVRRMGGRIRNAGWFVRPEEDDEEDGQEDTGETGNVGFSASNRHVSAARAAAVVTAEASETNAATNLHEHGPNEGLKKVGAGSSPITPLLNSEGDEERYEDAASGLGQVPPVEEDVPRRIKKEPLSDDSSSLSSVVESVQLDDLKKALSQVEDKVGKDGPEGAETPSQDSSDSDQSHRTVLSPDMESWRRVRDRVNDDTEDENEGEIGRQGQGQIQSKGPSPDQESDVDQESEKDTDSSLEEVDNCFLSREQVNDFFERHKNRHQSRNHGRTPDEDVTQPNHQRYRPIYTSRVLSPTAGPSSSTFQHSSKGKNRATISQPEAAKPASQHRQKRRNDSPSPTRISHQEQQWQEQDDENDPTADPAESLVIYRVKHQSALEEIERLKQDLEVANKWKRRANERLDMEMAESKIANDEVAELRAIHKITIQELHTVSGEMESVMKENRRLRDASGRFSSRAGKSELPPKGIRDGDEEVSRQLGKEKGNNLLTKKEKVGEVEDPGQALKERITALKKELEAEKQWRRKLEDDMRSLMDKFERNYE